VLDAAVLGDDEPRDCLRSIRLREVLTIYVDDVGICEDRSFTSVALRRNGNGAYP
jgi:hypothetical protein